MLRPGCALVAALLAFGTACSLAPAAEPAAPPHSLVVQAAKKQARECLDRREYGSAIRILEAYLAKIDGDAAYLALLEEAYRGYIAECRQKGQTEAAAVYIERLSILDPAVARTTAVSRPADSAVVKPNPTPAPPALPPDKIIERGDEAFVLKRYADAARCYEDAARAKADLPPLCRERWAFCKLHQGTEQLNQPAERLDWQALETEVRTALSLAPSLDYGRKLLETIEERSLPRGVQGKVPVQHHPQRVQGWLVAESQHFRVFHEDAAKADQALQAAERLRIEIAWRWLREANLDAWACKCDIFLHPTAASYAKTTGVSPELPGHSSIGAERRDASRVHTRRIDLRLDEPTALRAVLPHELTHVVLAGHYGTKPIPRWADEGMALLAEPADRLQHHRQVAARALAEARAFPLPQLLLLETYPSSQAVHTFYGQSLTLVEYLVRQKGHRAFTEFLREMQRDGFEPALAKHYGVRGIADLQTQWQQHIRGQAANAATGRKP